MQGLAIPGYQKLLTLDSNLTFLIFLCKTMTKDWFKDETTVCEKQDGYYMKAASSFCDEFLFSWQKIATKRYPMGGQWMIETGKYVPELMREINQIIKTLTIIYDEITDILEELIYGCYSDDVESIIKAIKTKEYSCTEECDHCAKLLKLRKDYEDEHNKLKMFIKK